MLFQAVPGAAEAEVFKRNHLHHGGLVVRLPEAASPMAATLEVWDAFFIANSAATKRERSSRVE